MTNPESGARIAARAADRLSRLVSDAGIAVAGVAMLASLCLVVYGVVLRYGLNQPQTWLDELVGYLLVATVMLGACDALRKREHIAIDLMTARLGRRGRFAVAILGLVAVGLTAALFIDEGWETVAFSRMVDMRSTGYLAAPLWIVQSLIPLGGALLLLNAVTLLARLLSGDLAADDLAPPAETEQPAEPPSERRT
ncbi:MAG: TRAP transporter small permease [Reyranellaceae bacterium]